MTRKVFEVEEQATGGRRPEFTLGGQDFDCIPEEDVSSLDLLDLIAGFTGDNGLARIQAMVQIFRQFIPADDGRPADGDAEGTPSSMDRFHTVVREKRVKLSLLSDIASYVLDEYLRFPTREASPQSTPSSTGSETVSSSNGAGSSAPQAVTSAA